MKASALIVAAMAVTLGGSWATAGSFQQGGKSVVVLRYGDANTTLTGSTGIAAYLDQYAVSGASATLVNTVALPTSGLNAIVGVSNGSRDGQIALSSDGLYIVVPGYNANAGSGFLVSDPDRAIARVNASGTTEVRVLPLGINPVLGTGDFRSVASPNGRDIYFATGSDGISAGLASFNSPYASQTYRGSFRSVEINNGQLYGLSGSTGYRGISAIGSGLPTTDVTPTATGASPISASNTVLTSITGQQTGGSGPGAQDVFFASGNVLYAAGSAAAAAGDDFRRYVRQSNGSYSLLNPTTGASGVTNANSVYGIGTTGNTYGVTAFPNTLGGFDVYMTTDRGLLYAYDANPTGTNFAGLTFQTLVDLSTTTGNPYGATTSNVTFRSLTQAPVVPEPTALGLLVPAGLMMLRRRK